MAVNTITWLSTLRDVDLKGKPYFANITQLSPDSKLFFYYGGNAYIVSHKQVLAHFLRVVA